MSLLTSLVEAQLLEPQLLEQFQSSTHPLTDLQKLQQLIHHQRLDESTLQAFLSDRYQVALLPEHLPFYGINDERWMQQTYEQTRVLLVQFGEHQYGALLSIHSDLGCLSLLPQQTPGPLTFYWTTSSQIEQYCQLIQNEGSVQKESAAEAVESLLEQAIQERCSDIHLESASNQLLVRFRVDGALKDAQTLPSNLKNEVLSRIKILSNMDIAIRRRPQDGHYAYQSKQGQHYDLRVSSIPTENGEKLVLRILDQSPIHFQLDALGFFQEDLGPLQRASHAQNGLILVVGPTGSGKTTTLYGMLNAINSKERNILTIEDPVEYHIPGINQVSVDIKQNLNFASALKAFLRQDPDVILVGEIRDHETAEIAIKAAQTGHLVLSTLHSTDVFTALQRLQGLGISQELLADTLRLIIAQRLIRKTGNAGRVPIYETLEMSPALQQALASKELLSSQDLANVSQSHYQPFDSSIQKHVSQQHITLKDAQHALL